MRGEKPSEGLIVQLVGTVMRRDPGLFAGTLPKNFISEEIFENLL
jgi:hypothetical protein